MKKRLIMLLSAGVMFLIMLSFSVIKESSFNKPLHSASKKVKRSDCVADINSFTVNSISSNSITVSWTYTGNPTSFNYGGYYNPGTPYPTTNVNVATTTITKTIPYGVYGIRIGVVCVCSDGTTVGSTHGAYCENGHVENYF
jgi:hypothetical protein